MRKFIYFIFLTLISNLCFGQDNPYAIFGYKTKNEYKTPEADIFKIINSDSTSNVRYMLFDRSKKTVSTFDKKNTVIQTVTLTDEEIIRWTSIDPLASKYPQLSPYNFVENNPIRMVDPDGREGTDWVKGKLGNIYWDKNANSQATTKQGDTYLGKDLTFKFNSYIDGKKWDGPMGSFPAGDKLTSTINLNSKEDSQGNLTSVSVNSSYEIGSTGNIFKGRDYFPGLGSDQNSAINVTNSAGFNATFEQHASVNGFEALGLNVMGYNVVNVAQKLTLGLAGNNLSVSAGTDVFPSATLSVNGNQLFQYSQPSFTGTHGTKPGALIDNGVGGINRERVPVRPAPSFYTRYKQ